MRFLATLLLWLVTTVALAVAVPTAWAQQHVVSADGYGALARSAAHDPQLQEAMASELTAQAVALVADRGFDVDSSVIRAVASAYTASSAFPDQFAVANEIVHRWMFTDSIRRSGDQWEVDLAPMLTDTSFQQTLTNVGVQVPSTLTVPVTVSTSLRPGQLRQLSDWGPWVSVGSTVLTGVCALLTLATSRSRGTGLASLGVSALLVGAGGWAGLEVARPYISDGLNQTGGDIHEVADVMVAHAEASLHQWLNLTLAAGGVLVVMGIILSMLGGLRRRTQ